MQPGKWAFPPMPTKYMNHTAINPHVLWGFSPLLIGARAGKFRSGSYLLSLSSPQPNMDSLWISNLGDLGPKRPVEFCSIHTFKPQSLAPGTCTCIPATHNSREILTAAYGMFLVPSFSLPRAKMHHHHPPPRVDQQNVLPVGGF